jgi:hypothetical protein
MGPLVNLLYFSKNMEPSDCAHVVATLMNYYEELNLNAIVKIEIFKEDYKKEFRKYGSKVSHKRFSIKSISTSTPAFVDNFR